MNLYSKTKLLIATLALSVQFSPYSHALSVSHTKNTAAINPEKKTHVFVIGYGGGLADQLFRTAVSRAQLYVQNNPENQVIFIGPDKIDKSSRYFDSYEEYTQTLNRLNLKIDLLDERYLLSNRLMNILSDYTQIVSLEFVSHSAAHQGVGLDDVPHDSPHYAYKRFNSKTEGLEELAAKFTKNAYVIVHGCNSGFIQAPQLAKILRVPVAGSLSFTNTQEIFANNNWYFNDAGKYPAGMSRASRNTLSYSDTDHTCASGNCHRMKPEPYPYAGYWGNLNAGLSHYKFFCGSAEASETCKKTMALSLLGFPSVVKNTDLNKESFKLLAKDFLCSDSNRVDERRRCFQKMEDSLSNPEISYTDMVRGKTLNCNFEKCDVVIECTEEAGSCQITHAPNNPEPRTMQNEFKAYVEGFELLQ